MLASCQGLTVIAWLLARTVVAYVLEGGIASRQESVRGGMAVVGRGVQLTVDGPVASEVSRLALAPDEQTVRRFEREAWVLARLCSAHVVRLFEVGRVDARRLFLVTEPPEGEVLALGEVRACGVPQPQHPGRPRL